MDIIELRNITKVYNKHIVLNNLTYNFKRNMTYLLVGANGSGKSTLIKIILALVKPTIGTAKLNEERIGYVPEKGSFPEIVQIDNFLESIALIRNLHPSQIKDKINFYLSYWELDGSKRMDKLSKGMMQKVLIIQALIHSPNLYIFDEPINGLDFESQKKFFYCINDLKTKSTIIIATHFRDYYQNLANKIIYINNGGFDEESI